MFLAISKIPPDVKIQRHLTSIHIDDWLREDLFHLRWWLLLCLLIFSVYVWWKIVDKTRLAEISLYAALTTIVTLGLVEIGEELILWDYPTDIIPIFPPLTSLNLASLPIIFSLIYQYFGTWSSFLLASLGVAAILCFILEPIMVWGGLYQLLKWKHFYGLPVYTIIAICIRLVLIRIFTTEKSSS
ncbi:hypothetical protein Dtox_2182 [Desulfofarcimen acetoxidans DSM 771]|uniref:Uncharacterized protein n=1 Tax=Desulfofarcimen acetoxidans (strain ATCC 49208 / DSM 771 / KCTC 5769 / VKM B-1644 / 5575) TaxID=485916 RepID=C8VZM5_DESAS|nr:CBO0543 family protein [Desulfofarcimen acetoxidans]ACV63003.1 hypothetical protein Dtox_2182 [Desulfofarcimen acetoxidans DSM 771]